MSLLVKICGVTTPDALDAALDAGADLVGFVFFDRSPRHLTVAAAAGLAARARGRAEVVALTVDAPGGLLAAIAEEVRPDWLQLHGAESPQAAAEIGRSFGGRVMKAVGVAGPADLERASAYAGVADRLLLDAKPPRGATRPGGNGLPFDWTTLKSPAALPPFLLSGGLGPANVGEAVRFARRIPGFAGVDVSSGVESAPGQKDLQLVSAFVRAARQAAREAEETAA